MGNHATPRHFRVFTSDGGWGHFRVFIHPLPYSARPRLAATRGLLSATRTHLSATRIHLAATRTHLSATRTHLSANTPACDADTRVFDAGTPVCDADTRVCGAGSPFSEFGVSWFRVSSKIPISRVRATCNPDFSPNFSCFGRPRSECNENDDPGNVNI